MERIGDEVQRELVRTSPAAGVPLASLTAVWTEAVGEAVARNAWPARVSRDGTLHVNTSSAAWAFELTQLAGEILEQLRSRLGEGTPPRLRFAAGHVPEPPRGEERETRSRGPVEVSPDVAATADAVASAIGDPDLRELVSRAARASLSRASSDRHF